MVYCTWKNHVFGHCPSSNIFIKTRFGNWICPVLGATILPEDGNRSSFQNVVFLETLDKGQSL
jgi:hypothetical protein